MSQKKELLRRKEVNTLQLDSLSVSNSGLSYIRTVPVVLIYIQNIKDPHNSVSCLLGLSLVQL